MKIFLRVLIIGAILLILVLLSIGIVRLVPKALSSLASATVSINSLFGGSGSNATSTTDTANSQNNPQVIPNGNGFIVVGQNGTTTSGSSTGANVDVGANSGTNANGTSSRSLLDILKPNFGNYPMNNYVPTPGSNGSFNGSVSATTTSNTSGTTRVNASTNTNTTVYRSAQTCTVGGSPNLAVSVIGKGVISKTTGLYIESNSFTTGDMVSIKFKVENRGTCPSGTWSLVSTFPSQNTTDKQRSVTGVASLGAGSAVTGQANFDFPLPGNVVAQFAVTDSSGRDSNSADNIATASLSVLNTGTGTIGNNYSGNTPVIGDGRPDLLVRIVQTGVLTYSNQFIPTGNNSFRTGDRVAVQFEVINQGQTATGLWNFRAELSDYPTRIYNNPQYEAGIPAGGKTTYTIGFDNVKVGNNTITLYADSMNQVNEFNESNNTSMASFYMNY